MLLGRNTVNHAHANLYDVNRIEGAVRDHIKSLGIIIHMEKRVRDVEFDGHKIKGLYLADDSFVDGDILLKQQELQVLWVTA